MLYASWRAFLADLPRPPLGWVLGIVALTNIGLALYIDRATALFMKDAMVGPWRQFFELVTMVGDPTPWILGLLLAIIICFLSARREMNQARRMRLLLHARNCWFVILSCLVSGAIHHIIKVLVGRYRPRYLFTEDLFGFSPMSLEIARNSFPSGHTQTIVSICFSLFLVYPRLAGIYLVIAAVVALSRITLVAHYPSDVFFGAYLGITTAILLKRHYLDSHVTTELNVTESGR
mgnify:CR=1 FL=1